VSVIEDNTYVEENLFTVGDLQPQDRGYSESAWAVNPMPMESPRSFPASGNGGIIVEPHYRQEYGYYNISGAPRFMDYLALEGLGIDFESERGQKLMNICAHHMHYGGAQAGTYRSILANIKAAKLVSEWLTPGELAELEQDRKVTIKSKKYKNRTYIVHENPSDRVEVWEKGRLGNKRKAKACGVVAEAELVQGDKFLAKVMAVKTDEEDFLKRSNVQSY
jgi:hypothetical protein